MLIIKHVKLILECMLCLCNSMFTSLFLNYDCNRKSLITDIRVFHSFNKIVYFLILNLTFQNSLNLILLNVIDF